MFYDLNVSWKPDLAEYQNLQNTIIFLAELGYNVIALNHTLTGKLPADLSCPIPSELPFEVPQKIRILRRCTLVLSDPSQNHRLSQLSSNYDILALRPVNEKSLQQACQSLDCDIISMDLSSKLDYYIKMKMVAPAIERGIKFEICYSPGISTQNSGARRNLISNATQLIRATRGGRGLILSSEASRASGCRGPSDVINLAAVWGLGQEKGHEAVSKLARSVVVSAHLKRNSYRGVIDVVYGGEKPAAPIADAKSKTGQKRPADSISQEPDSKKVKATPVVSKREQKRQKKALLESQVKTDASKTGKDIPTKTTNTQGH